MRFNIFKLKNSYVVRCNGNTLGAYYQTLGYKCSNEDVKCSTLEEARKIFANEKHLAQKANEQTTSKS